MVKRDLTRGFVNLNRNLKNSQIVRLSGRVAALVGLLSTEKRLR